MPKLTTNVKLNANLQYEYKVYQRDSKGRFMGSKKFVVSSFSQVRQLETKVRTAKTVKQFESRAKYTLGEKSYQKKVNGFNQLMDNVYSNGASDKYDAMFMWLMRKLGLDGLDSYYDAYPEELDKMYKTGSPMSTSERGDENIIESRQERQSRVRTQNTERIKEMIRNAGYTEEMIRQVMIRIYREDNPQLSYEQQNKALQNFNLPYVNYLKNHWFISYEEMGE